MSKNQTACCPSCRERIPFKKFVQLNNFSATNCGTCNTRIEISNRSANAVMAGVCVIISAIAIVFCAYIGEKEYQSFLGGLFSGICLSVVMIVAICRYAYRHSELNRICLP
ncbi:MAG: hypothetical protein M0Q26_12485 [Chitinophagaceae bacterium]|nr:hypothetical protein [Chitinophagaceae bacterium]MDP3667007.1 hypothetical protein [Sediminibacterium sp.]